MDNSWDNTHVFGKSLTNPFSRLHIKTLNIKKFGHTLSCPYAMYWAGEVGRTIYMCGCEDTASEYSGTDDEDPILANPFLRRPYYTEPLPRAFPSYSIN